MGIIQPVKQGGDVSMKLSQYNKAIAALVVGLVTVIITHFGIQTSPDLQAAIVTLITTLVVFLIPNKTQ